jgi:hypothetical protein
VGTLKVQGRYITEADLAEIRGLRTEHPEWPRYRLSRALAERWQWRNDAGQLKDMAARTLLAKLAARGLIDLPPPLWSTKRKTPRAPPGVPASVPPVISSDLAALQPVHLQVVASLTQRRRITELLERHHYRGYHGAVGENVQYLAHDVRGRELAVMVFGAAAWKLATRDQFIGWSPNQRAAQLGRLANQQRFLILPWVRVPHLASHLLAQATRRLSQDWQRRYGHPIWLVESFVEAERFAATTYKAAGWLLLGQTTGRTRQDRHRQIQVAIKTVWVKALHRHFRQLLKSHETPQCAAQTRGKVGFRLSPGSQPPARPRDGLWDLVRPG